MPVRPVVFCTRAFGISLCGRVKQNLCQADRHPVSVQNETKQGRRKLETRKPQSAPCKQPNGTQRWKTYSSSSFFFFFFFFLFFLFFFLSKNPFHVEQPSLCFLVAIKRQNLSKMCILFGVTALPVLICSNVSGVRGLKSVFLNWLIYLWSGPWTLLLFSQNCHFKNKNCHLKNESFQSRKQLGRFHLLDIIDLWLPLWYNILPFVFRVHHQHLQHQRASWGMSC